MTLDAYEFIRRFQIHAPTGFHASATTVCWRAA
jgi:hypothetical protein